MTGGALDNKDTAADAVIRIKVTAESSDDVCSDLNDSYHSVLSSSVSGNSYLSDLEEFYHEDDCLEGLWVEIMKDLIHL